MTLTAQHLQILGVVILVLIAVAFIWWVVRAAVGRPKRGQVAYWLQSRRDDDDDNDQDDGPEVHDQ